MELDMQLKVLLLNHFALKHTEDLNNRDITHYVGVSQSQISLYFNGRSKCPDTVRISIASNICYFKHIKEHPADWLDTLNGKERLLPDVYELMHFIADNGRLKEARGRTERTAKRLTWLFNSLSEQVSLFCCDKI